MDQADAIQSLCQQGQQLLEANDYRPAERVLVQAEQLARDLADWNTLSRLYMPLQESRRQRRLLCSEGVCQMDVIAAGPDQPIDLESLLAAHPQGQFLIAGYGSLAPAVEFRRLADAANCYADAFLAAVYPIIGGAQAIVIAPHANTSLPPAGMYAIDSLMGLLPPQVILINRSDLPTTGDKSPATMAWVQSIWEKLHLPYLAMADSTQQPIHRIDAYRQVLAIDYACELAHQRLSDVARSIRRPH